MNPTRILATSLALVLPAVPAVFSARPAAPAAAVTAAAIAAPTGFTATAATSTTATLSWTAPATLTGYTLAQSPGTLAGCSATPAAGATSCTATGLSPSTAYTWTLSAVYHNWKSSPVTAGATTHAVVGATLLGAATDGTAGTSTSTVTGVTSTSGADLLILVYRQNSNGNLGISQISGSAISGTPAQVGSQVFNSNGKYELWAYRATGSGASGGAVTVTFISGNNVSTSIDVIQLSGDKAGSPVVQSVGSASATTASTATGGTLVNPSAADGEIFFTGLVTSTTMTTPAGYSALDATSPGVHAAWFSPTASTTPISTTLGTASFYGTLELEIAAA